MQAIITKYIGPSNTKWTRIKASCPQGNLTIPFPHELSDERAHAVAAMALVRKLGWNSESYPQDWYCGEIVGGYAFVLGGNPYAPSFQ